MDSACQSSSAQGSTLSSMTMLGRKRSIGSGSGILLLRSANEDCHHTLPSVDNMAVGMEGVLSIIYSH